MLSASPISFYLLLGRQTGVPEESGNSSDSFKRSNREFCSFRNTDAFPWETKGKMSSLEECFLQQHKTLKPFASEKQQSEMQIKRL